METHTKFLSEILKGRDRIQELETDERIILKWMLNMVVVCVWTKCAQDTVASSCGYNDKLKVSIKVGKFLDKLNNC